ncbi:MAG: ribose-phosphate diphosphokinase [Clostridiales bacterium]|nr:MAG: ribose-phosphate diphosphokinase [Clostridiales bacterium]
MTWQKIAEHLGVSLGDAQVGKFSDGEIYVNINETVRGSDVFVVQSTCGPVNDNLMELLIMIDAFRRASAGRITAVMPYFGYARQDRKAKSSRPDFGKSLLQTLSQPQAQTEFLQWICTLLRFRDFSMFPLTTFSAYPFLAKFFREEMKRRFWKNIVVVSPDLGSVTRARNFAQRLDAPIAIIDKRRPKANVSEVMNIIGDIKRQNRYFGRRYD